MRSDRRGFLKGLLGGAASSALVVAGKATSAPKEPVAAQALPEPEKKILYGRKALVEDGENYGAIKINPLSREGLGDYGEWVCPTARELEDSMKYTITEAQYLSEANDRLDFDLRVLNVGKA